MSDAGDLDDLAAALYSGAPEEFIASRNALAKEADDSDLAKRIRSLRKPTVAAWVVNVFARERSARLGEALQLAAELRDAQEDLDAATLSQLGRQRRALTNQLAAEAAALASAQGARVTDATLEAVRQTISAAFFDQDAAAAVASGRLVHDLEPTGSFDLDAAVGGGRPSPPAAAEPVADEVGARRERRNAERALREAEKAHERAKRDRRRAEDETKEAGERADRLATHVAELEEELGQARKDAAQAHKDAASAADRRERAAEQASAAAAAVDDARRALDEL